VSGGISHIDSALKARIMVY